MQIQYPAICRRFRDSDSTSGGTQLFASLHRTFFPIRYRWRRGGLNYLCWDEEDREWVQLHPTGLKKAGGQISIVKRFWMVSLNVGSGCK